MVHLPRMLFILFYSRFLMICLNREATPSFALLDIQGPIVVTYVYQLIEGEVRVEKVEYRFVSISSCADGALIIYRKPLEVHPMTPRPPPSAPPVASPPRDSAW